MHFSITDINLWSLLPEIILLAGATGTIFLSDATGRERASFCATITVIASLLTAVFLFTGTVVKVFDGFIVKDEITLLFLLLIDLAALAAIALSHNNKGGFRSSGEYFGLLLFALFGMHVMAAGRDLFVIFLGLEILALPLYILVGFNHYARDGMEGAVKYFLLGSFASAIFLLGLAFYYGATGTTALEGATGALTSPILIYAGLALIVVGIGFKLAAVPFHIWAPDAYEGAPVPVAAYLSVAPKIAALAVLLRLGLTLTGTGSHILIQIIMVMSVASMIIGNLAALRQAGFVRMLAYSGIAHVGYMLIGLPALQTEGGAALSFYILVYIFMNMGAFAAAVAIGPHGDSHLQIDDLSGLAARRPFLAFALAVFMVSLAGLPPTGGFFAKFYLFKASIFGGYLPVVIIAIVMSIISLFYYLRVVMVMYMSPAPEGTLEPRTATPLMSGVLAVLVVLVFLTGIQPGDILKTILGAFQ